MQGRWFNTTVVTLWLATMAWLVWVKVLPPLLIGDPPSYSQIVEAEKDAPPVGWRLSLGRRPLGWALSDAKLQSFGLTDIRGRVHFDALPLEEMIPRWLRAFSRLLERPLDRLQMDARSVLTIGPLGNLVQLDSTVRVLPFDEVIHLHGTVEGRQLVLAVRDGDVSFTNETSLPADGLLCDALSPQMQLPGLRAGQTWTVPVYSPLWSAKTPLEIVKATVERLEPLLWNGAVEDCWLVVYTNDSENGPAGSQSPRGTLWVRRDGTVLKQQIVLFDSTITFDRLPDGEALKLVEAAGHKWWTMEKDPADDPRREDDSTPIPTVR